MVGFELLLAIAAGLGGLGALETFSHRRRLRRIPIRIHVAGTRGKSSVTRLISAAMREAGIATAAKTTGTLARMILPNGQEVPVFRPAGANIIEQTRIIATAADMKVDALVIECMALIPELHWISESRLVRATHGVITNARADHLDVMGPTEVDVAKTLASMTPVNGVLITAERRLLDVMAHAAKDRGSRLVAVGDADVADISDADMAPFCYTEHKENVALSLRVVAEVGVDRETALRGMYKATPDPGALTQQEVDFFGRRIVFVNGFAANDPESTAMIWHLAKRAHPDVQRRIAVFNLRADRPARTLQMAKDATFWREADKVVLMGTGAYLFGRVANTSGLEPGRFVYAEQQRVEEIFETLVGLCGPASLIVGMGNIGGQGLDLVRYFRNRAVLRGLA